MKTRLIFVALLCSVSALNIFAQPNTGMTVYGHGSTSPILSGGTYVSNDPGFILARYSTDINNRKNVHYNNETTELSLEIPDLPDGCYFLHFDSENLHQVYKFIINKD